MTELKKITLLIALLVPLTIIAQSIKIVTNQVGYEPGKAKRAVIVADEKLNISQFQLVDADTGSPLFTGKPVYSGPVDKWKHFQFWTIDFSGYSTPGKYRLTATTPNGTISSYPFSIGDGVLEKATISDVIYYFKGQRSSGLFDKATGISPLPVQPIQWTPMAAGMMLPAIMASTCHTSHFPTILIRSKFLLPTGACLKLTNCYPIAPEPILDR